MNSPLDLTKVRLQASGDHGMFQSMRKTVATAGEQRTRLNLYSLS